MNEPKPPHPWQDLLDRIGTMSPEELRESLVRSGIIRRDGKLTEDYKPADDPKKDQA